MKFKRFITRMLAIGLILNNSNLSFAGVLSEDGRYEMFKGRGVYVENILKEDKAEVEVEGNTLVNIASKYFRNTDYYTKNSDGTINIVARDNTDPVNYGHDKVNFINELKPDTAYTFMVDNLNTQIIIRSFGDNETTNVGDTLVNVTGQRKVTFKTPLETDKKVYIKVLTADKTHPLKNLSVTLFEHSEKDNLALDYFNNSNYYKKNSDNTISIVAQDNTNPSMEYSDVNFIDGLKLNTEYTLEVNNSSLRIIIRSYKINESVDVGETIADTTGKTSFTFKTPLEVDRKIYVKILASDGRYPINNVDVKLYEGGHEEHSAPFNGMKSVGESDDGNHKISLISSNYNWLEGVKIDGGATNIGSSQEDISRISLPVVDCTPNTEYTMNNGDKYYSWIAFSDDSGIIHTRLGWEKRNTIIAPENATKMRIQFAKDPVSGKESIFIEDVQDISIEGIGSYSSNEILLDEPLRGLPNGVKDRIVKKNNSWVVERNVGSIILDGSEDYEIFKTSTGTTGFIISSIDTSLSTGYEEEIMCNTIPYGNYNKYASEEVVDWESENFIISNRESGKVGLSLLMPTSIASTVRDVEKWMSNNRPEVVYALPETKYEHLKAPSVVDIYEGITNISNNSLIPSNIKVTVDRIVNRVVEAIEVAKDNPTVQNIAQARYWINLLDESALKDEFQGEVSDITSIEGMELEKKTVSANLDVYVKSENALSMSLNTNYVSFDNFSGVEDMEMQNAVGIIVNSSLPYDLNAYLESEMYNADKTRILDKRILNIKENTEPDYQAFVNTSDKVILKEDCMSGNYNEHKIDIRLKGNISHEKDVYKTTIKFEVEQK